MTQPISLDSKSPRFGLPLLFAGQAQKDFYINEAHALIDALLHPVVEGTAAAPPEQPAKGSCWIVAATPSAEWIDRADQIACFQSGTWLFASPSEGMRVFDRSAGIEKRYRDGWHAPTSIATPAGGATVDAEARAAIAELIEALSTMGLTRQSQ